MILWTIKQMLSLRQALLGRARPSELAWGLALGVAIGVVPKGNLVSVMLIGLLVSLRVNHGIAALAAVATSLAATWFDPWTHQLGTVLLGAEGVQTFLGRVWNWPLMPWTDLNNTVVMGSTVAAGLALVPTYVLSVPVFRWFAPRVGSSNPSTDPPPVAAAAADVGLGETDATAALVKVEYPQDDVAATIETAPLTVIDDELPSRADHSETDGRFETHIDVIRLKPASDENPPADSSQLSVPDGQMNEALGYLLRRLRDSRQGKAA